MRRAVDGRLAQSKRNIAIVVVVGFAGVFVIISVGVLTVRCEYGAWWQPAPTMAGKKACS